MKQVFLTVPLSQPEPTRPQKLVRRFIGSFLTPFYWLLAHRYPTPGLPFHWLCAKLGVSLALRRRAPLPLGWAYHFIFWPMDSTRYFEFDVTWRALGRQPIRHYLDVSSPRLFPLVLLHQKRALSADLLNPDPNDLAATANIARAAGLTCQLHSCLIENAPFAAASFDLITSLSVVEHIPDDTHAIQKMWELLAPGGRLLLSVPCAAEGVELYTNRNEYGLLEPDETGFAFFERLYDAAVLNEHIFCVTGQPERQAVYGEKIAGSFAKNAERKRAEYLTAYPFWREPFMMGQEYTFFHSVADLPGEGVIGLEFIKP